MARLSSSSEAKRQADGGDNDPMTLPLRNGWRRPAPQTYPTQPAPTSHRNVTAPVGAGGVEQGPAQQCGDGGGDDDDAAAAAAAAAPDPAANVACCGQEGLRRLVVNQGRISISGASGVAPAEDDTHAPETTVLSADETKDKTQAPAEKVVGEVKVEGVPHMALSDDDQYYIHDRVGSTEDAIKVIKEEESQTPASDVLSEVPEARPTEHRASVKPELADLPRPTHAARSGSGVQASQASVNEVAREGQAGSSKAVVAKKEPDQTTPARTSTTTKPTNLTTTTSSRVTRSMTRASNANPGPSAPAVAASSSRVQAVAAAVKTDDEDGGTSGPPFAWDVPVKNDKLSKRPHWRLKRMAYPEGYDPHGPEQVAAQEYKYGIRRAVSGPVEQWPESNVRGAVDEDPRARELEQWPESNVWGAVDEDPREREVKRVLARMVQEAMAKNKAEEEAEQEEEERRNKARRIHPDIPTSLNEDFRQCQAEDTAAAAAAAAAAARTAPQEDEPLPPPAADGPRPGQTSTVPAEFFPSQLAHMSGPGNAQNRQQGNNNNNNNTTTSFPSRLMIHELDDWDLLQAMMDRMYESDPDLARGEIQGARDLERQYSILIAMRGVGGPRNDETGPAAQQQRQTARLPTPPPPPPPSPQPRPSSRQQ